MLKKKVTLRKRGDFVKVSESGLCYRSREIVVQARMNSLDTFRVGFTASKKVGNAVSRNRCKRRMRAVAREILSEIGFSGTDYVIIARKSLISASWLALLESLKSAVLYLNRKISAYRRKTQKI